ncbi:MAG TPA: hypothetical protein VGD37_27290 [Kofleriaceae bacterium]|jgi:hypothetical protein
MRQRFATRAHVGPVPYARALDAWFEATANDTPRRVSGFWYPSFSGGTIFSFQIRGLYVDDLA